MSEKKKLCFGYREVIYFALLCFPSLFLFCNFTGAAELKSVITHPIRWAVEPTSSKSELSKIRRVIVSVESNMRIANQICEDVISVELMESSISVVSRENRDREQIRKLVEIGEEADEKANKKSKENLADLLTVAKIVSADAMVVVTLVADVAQQNVYAGEPVRVTEVRNNLFVQAASLTVVEVSSGKLLLAGFVGYESGVPLVEAAKDISQGLVKKLR